VTPPSTGIQARSGTCAGSPQPCLLHADHHPLGDDCLSVVVWHSLGHPALFSRAAHDDYHWRTEQAILDRHIRTHLATLETTVTAYDPDGERQPDPQENNDLEQAA
jgi:hypothetical protein